MPGTKAMKSSATTSKPKKEKDPNAPKRPQSAYFLFTADKRPQLKANCPDMKVTEVAKECGRLWKLVTPNEKKKYDALAAEDKERYEREMKDYNKN